MVMLQQWSTLGTLAFTILLSAMGLVAILYNHKNQILTRMGEDKQSIDDELTALRQSAYEEYTTLRKEIGESSSIARVEFGETVLAIRQKITEVELWTRDQLSETRHTLISGMDMRHSIAIEMIEKTEDRMRYLELFAAGQGYRPEG